ncbi:hypothetical protein K388_04260 [Streptomyces sp. KhCrAH-43]|uniref:DUF6777 domain-containing protein n=1 Tax=unclassified Streptomyces TaxID=2593676 RepID=UPI00035FFB52|nr:DUF6777 domain-containing protein [Streptomyces sp. KhCrAH-43]MYS33010.1 hypothetical protein [Streptomyces sp. SID4920]MYX67791.1 hypothetical protein [Streptomyces sp. SID8373]RAJ58199.1 hypothetical protein K388_04260 [Streptomyces sp. KhCrAH-43]
MHSRIRLRRTALALLSAGFLLAAGCARGTSGGGGPASGTALAGDVLLQPAADPGTAPFTASTAGGPAVRPDATHSGAPRSPSAPGKAKGLTRTGATPGLYAGTRAVPSCDVEALVRMLDADPAKEQAFARTVSVPRGRVAGFLRGLTPVQLRADTLVTGHGFRAGEVTTYQSVLQAGTAVMVDGRGLPRVRCACGNPLHPPSGEADAAAAAGERWAGFDPARTVVVAPAARPVTELVIVDVVHHSWLARPVGDEGAGDRAPEVPPPYGPGTDITGPLPDVPVPSTKPGTPTGSPSPDGPSEPPEPTGPPEDCPTGVAPEPPGEPAVAGGLPARAPGETHCPAPTGDPTDEPSGDPSEPDEPPMTDAPPTSVQLPRDFADTP